MRPSRLTHKAKVTALALFIGAAPAHSQTLELGLEQGRIVARQEALAGNYALARQFALALTVANPDDRTALVVLAAVQPQLGEARAGRLAGVKAYRLSTSSDERYEAARLVALAAANEERYTLAQVWLRRAAVNAPNEMAYAQTQTDFRGIRALNPWSANVNFSLTPSDNINGGASGGESCLFVISSLDGSSDPFCGATLSGSALALPGVSASVDARFAYRLTDKPDQRTRLTARAYTRVVWLSDEAQDIAPGSEGSDFGSNIIEVGVSHDHRVGDGAVSASFDHGWYWFGGDLRSNFDRVRLGYSSPVADRTRASVTGTIQQTNYVSGLERVNRLATLTFGVQHGLANNDRLSTQLTYSDNRSPDNANERYKSLLAQVGYTFAKPLGPANVSTTVGVERRVLEDYTFPFLSFPDGRTDTRLFASLTAVFSDIEYAGFVPTVSLGYQSTDSNFSRFERDEMSVNIGVRSSF